MAKARGTRVPIRLVVLLTALGVVALLVGGALGGPRAYVVESPSMGEAAPVGTLVIGTTRIGPLRVGDVITYRPPDGGRRPFTHRVVEVASDGVRVRGDINGADDPWTVTSQMVQARTLLLIPGLGWLVRALPFLVGGFVVQQLVCALVPAALRLQARLLIGSLTIAVVSVVLRPFTGFMLLQSSVESAGVRAEVVSTALLPIRLLAEGGGQTSLGSGQVGHLLLPRGVGGRVSMSSELAMDATAWALVIAVSTLPLIIALASGARRARIGPS